jgi:uncharacterized protein (TIRG00374 family)
VADSQEQGIDMSRFLIFLGKIILAVALLFWLNQLDLLKFSVLEDFFERPLTLFLLLFLVYVTYPLCSVRWNIILRTMGFELSLYTVYKMVYQSAFIGLFLPGVVGADGVRIIYGVAHSPKKKIKMWISVLVDRAIGVVALLSLGGVAAGIYLLDETSVNIFVNQVAIGLSSICLVTVFLFIMSLLFHKQLENYLESKIQDSSNNYLQNIFEVFQAVNILLKYPGQLFAAYILSLIVHLKNIIVLMMIIEVTINNSLGLVESLIAGTVTFIINFIPFTPGGLGVGEMAFGHLANAMTEATSSLPFSSIMVIFRLLLVMSLLPALVSILKTRQGIKPSREQSHG